MSNLTIALVQTNLFWENKTDNIKMLSEKIYAIIPSTDLVILPEMFSTGFSMKPEILAEKMDGETMQWLEKTSAAKNVVITGSLIIKEKNNYYNRLIWMLPNGKYTYYDKRHLFAFGKENKHYKAGTKRLLVEANDWKINLQVCYDLRFPVWARQDGVTEYDLLVYVANWPEHRIYAWKSLLVARAIENQCFVVAVNRVGIDGNGIFHNGCSMVINPLGEILYQKEKEEDVFTITLDKDILTETRTRFPFWKDADEFKIY